MKCFLFNLLMLFLVLRVSSQAISVNPSPFNYTATASYTLSSNDTASIHIFNRLGQCVDTVLAWSFQLAGTYQKNIDLSSQPENIYVVLFKYGTKKQTFTVVNTTQPLGINQNKEISEIILYPNPTHDFINISVHTQTESTTLTLTNSLGEVVYFLGHLAQNEKVDLRWLPGGLYFVKIKSVSSSRTAKLIKE